MLPFTHRGFKAACNMHISQSGEAAGARVAQPAVRRATGRGRWCERACKMIMLALVQRIPRVAAFGLSSTVSSRQVARVASQTVWVSGLSSPAALSSSFSSSSSSSSSRSFSRSSSRTAVGTALAASDADVEPYLDFLRGPAVIPNPPRRLSTFLSLLQGQGMELVDPSAREGLMPFFVPIARDPSANDQLIGLLRWPTAPETLEMPVVRHGEVGVDLLYLSVDDYITSYAAEADFKGVDGAQEIVNLCNKDHPPTTAPYVPGSVAKLGYGLQRYQLLKCAPTPAIYEWLSDQHLAKEKSDDISALTASEKANSVFLGWGRSYGYYSRVLNRLYKRQGEAKDAAKAALRTPCWTITPSRAVLEEIVDIAGYEGMEAQRKLRVVMKEDEQKDKITEGKAPPQVALDRSAHLMDAVVFGHSSWDGIREELACFYEEGLIPEMASFVRMQ